jgi:ferric-dicitrate binding protein FerR (iron transport regulator)
MAYLEEMEPAAARRRTRADAARPTGRRSAEKIGLAAFALALAGLMFWLAYAAVEEPAVAVILTLLFLLPVAGLAAASPAPGPMRR